MTVLGWIVTAFIAECLITGAVAYRFYILRRRQKVLDAIHGYHFGASVRTLQAHRELQHCRKSIKRDLEWWKRKKVLRTKTYGTDVVVYSINEQGE